MLRLDRKRYSRADPRAFPTAVSSAHILWTGIYDTCCLEYPIIDSSAFVDSLLENLAYKMQCVVLSHNGMELRARLQLDMVIILPPLDSAWLSHHYADTRPDRLPIVKLPHGTFIDPDALHDAILDTSHTWEDYQWEEIVEAGSGRSRLKNLTIRVQDEETKWPSCECELAYVIIRSER